MNKNKSTRGFTLIELLVVIAIIGLLSTIVVASLTTVRKKARDTKRVADIKSLQLALEMYFDTNKTFPPALTDLVSAYIPAVPVDPSGSGVYVYKYSACGSKGYHLGATLEDDANSALSSDSDKAADATNCTADFNGGSVTSCGGTAGTDACYDIRNF